MERGRIFAAEAVGTAGLMLGGVGAAVFAGGDIGFLGVSLAFGLSLLMLAALLGHVSGCHVNPAVTVGLLLARKVPGRLVPTYLTAQAVGAVVGAGIVFAVASGRSGFDASLGFAANGFGELSPGGYGLLAVLAAEVVFTALFVLAVLATTRPGFPSGLGPVVAGLALALVHLVTIPISNTSVNPARSLGAAVFQGVTHSCSCGRSCSRRWSEACSRPGSGAPCTPTPRNRSPRPHRSPERFRAPGESAPRGKLTALFAAHGQSGRRWTSRMVSPSSCSRERMPWSSASSRTGPKSTVPEELSVTDSSGKVATAVADSRCATRNS
jgi:aquaporin Z